MMWTVGSMATDLGVPTYRVLYVIATRKIEPDGRIGHYRIFGADGFRKVSEAIASMGETK